MNGLMCNSFPPPSGLRTVGKGEAPKPTRELRDQAHLPNAVAIHACVPGRVQATLPVDLLQPQTQTNSWERKGEAH